MRGLISGDFLKSYNLLSNAVTDKLTCWQNVDSSFTRLNVHGILCLEFMTPYFLMSLALLVMHACNLSCILMNTYNVLDKTILGFGHFVGGNWWYVFVAINRSKLTFI